MSFTQKYMYMYVFTMVVFIANFPMHSYPIDIFADSVTFILCCFWTNANKASLPVLIKSVHIFYNVILARIDTTNFIKSLHGKRINIRVEVN